MRPLEPSDLTIDGGHSTMRVWTPTRVPR